ncbi:hypothetical protein P154DRAFT_619283 [Amniculicola lignicola CBS 123094]|uniref:COP9 signalosome complex subunit 6 n=1 Tax=Amniculicola lignicola CBS 123094 TaxID=1392246 RepID=A0A6A5WLI2_9PLEO|nr:hypothetical protein P154DRAFT_619283 [Amniculicola lignicola CBS 123094]
MAADTDNPLLSTSRASDTTPTVQLHPLVLLTISDSITRHTLRQQSGPIAGAILGLQNGQEITMEVAFQAKLRQNAEGEVVLDDEWFAKRLEDFRDVHKQPQLDLVGWFTLGPASGPQPHHLPIHTRISEVYTESPILFLFHPSNAQSEATAAGKLPLTLYESLYETTTSGPDDKAMDIDGATQTKALKFRELVYSVETGEAEMISVDFVARGGGNATAVEGTKAAAGAKAAESSKAEEEKAKKGKAKAKAKEEAIDETAVLTGDDEEILSTLTAKINAIRMLSRRLILLRKYLASLPPSYLSDPTLPLTTPEPTQTHPLPLSHPVLRSISATLSRTSILTPPETSLFTLEQQQSASDVQLIALLSSITSSVGAAKELGRKSYLVESGKHNGKRSIFSGSGAGGGYDMGPGGGGAYFDTVMGGAGGSGGGLARGFSDRFG